jgi:hypothetical protein
MQLDNRTVFPAALFRGCIDEKRLFGSLVARMTYDLRGDRLELAREQSWPVQPGPWNGPCGPMEGDELFYRGGVDILVFGSARSPTGRPTTWIDVTVQAGRDFATSVRVFGDRFWERRGRGIVMSPPGPFDAIQLTLANAYGGKDEWDELPVAFPSNPDGKGYVISEESAPGKALPNIEDPDNLIRTWEDQPQPVGVGACPMSCGARILDRVVFDEDGMLKELKPTFYNHAFPRLIAPFLQPGEWVRVTGVRPGNPIEFALPQPPVTVHVSIGTHREEVPPPIDQVGIDVERQQVFLTYRYPFRYIMTPLERRSCELLPAKSAGAGAAR